MKEASHKSIQHLVKYSLPLLGTALAVVPLTSPILTEEAEASENVYQSQAAFIEQIGGTASQVAASSDLYASVMIAQALVESANGTSTLSCGPYYNLFGVKEYDGGPAVYMSTLEYLDGEWVTMKEPFRCYNSYYESFVDQANLLRTVKAHGGYYYAGAWKSHSSSYLDATAYLTGRYATDPGYGAKLNQLIQAYNLTRFDTPSSGYSTVEFQATVSEAENATYTVRSGDSLWSIANAHGLSIDDFMVKNGFTLESTIMNGQEVYV